MDPGQILNIYNKINCLMPKKEQLISGPFFLGNIPLIQNI
jgi:hypothetical protein